MKAEVKKAFPGRPDNEIKTREIKVGEIINGDLAEVAVAEGWAEEVGPPKKTAEKDPPKKVEEATEEDVLAYLNGLKEKPAKKPKVGELGKAMEKKVSGKTLDAAWPKFSAKDEG